MNICKGPEPPPVTFPVLSSILIEPSSLVSPLTIVGLVTSRTEKPGPPLPKGIINNVLHDLVVSYAVPVSFNPFINTS